MDLLYRRYASPFDFLNRVIKYKRLNEIISFIVAEFMEEENEQKTWEFYLHRPIEESYNDFKAEILSHGPSNTEMTEAEFKATVKDSKFILKNFNPEKKEVK